jgi:hypothetical protein
MPPRIPVGSLKPLLAVLSLAAAGVLVDGVTAIMEEKNSGLAASNYGTLSTLSYLEFGIVTFAGKGLGSGSMHSPLEEALAKRA